MFTIRPYSRSFIPGTTAWVAKNVPANVNLEHPVEILHGYFVDEKASAPDPGVVDQDIDRPERIGGIPDAGLQGSDVPDVHLQRMQPGGLVRAPSPPFPRCRR